MGAASPSVGSPASENKPKPWPGIILYGKHGPAIQVYMIKSTLQSSVQYHAIWYGRTLNHSSHYVLDCWSDILLQCISLHGMADLLNKPLSCVTSCSNAAGVCTDASTQH